MPRDHGIDFNPGGFATINGETPITKFGFSYRTATNRRFTGVEDLSATVLRIRNTNCEGSWPCDFLVSPYDVATLATITRAAGSTMVAELGHLEIRDQSFLSFRAGTIASGTVELFDWSTLNIFYKNGTLPLVNGVEIDDPAPATTTILTMASNHPSLIQFENSITNETMTLKVIAHDIFYGGVNPLPSVVLVEAAP